jgi:hypothetical protein
MGLKLFALAACFLISSACAQDNLDYDILHAGLNDSGIGCSPSVGSDLSSTELGPLPRADVPLQKPTLRSRFYIAQNSIVWHNRPMAEGLVDLCL